MGAFFFSTDEANSPVEGLFALVVLVLGGAESRNRIVTFDKKNVSSGIFFARLIDYDAVKICALAVPGLRRSNPRSSSPSDERRYPPWSERIEKMKTTPYSISPRATSALSRCVIRGLFCLAAIGAAFRVHRFRSQSPDLPNRTAFHLSRRIFPRHRNQLHVFSRRGCVRCQCQRSQTRDPAVEQHGRLAVRGLEHGFCDLLGWRSQLRFGAKTLRPRSTAEPS